MSVINDMLASLEARRAAAPAGTTPLRTAPRAASPRRLQVIMLLGVAATCAAAFGDWPKLMPGGVKLPMPVAMAADSVTAAPPLAELAAAAATVAPTPSPAVVQAPVAAAPAPTKLALAAPSMLGSRTLPDAAASAPAPAPAHAGSAGSTGSAEKKLIPISTAQRAALAYRQATELGASGHSSQAIERALEALQADPDHAGARQLAAVLMFEARRFDEASTLLRAGLERTPPQPRLAYLLARLKAETGDAAGALALLPQGAGQSAEANGLRAAILAQQGRYAQALPSYEAALRLDPANASWWLGLGVALDADGQGALAKQALQRARALGTLRGDVLAYVDQKIASLE